MKALSLFSGGLDSILSVKIVQDQGIDVLAIHFDTGFGGKNWAKKKEYLIRICKNYNIPLEIVDIKEHYLEDVLFNPKYGYGKAFNPCIDCHGYMFFNAASLLKKYNGDFLISGEVVGQRPMSQRSEALKQVEELSGAKGLVLRPLSAQHLAITIPEEKGWIDRKLLLDIKGRSRYRQIELAKHYGIEEHETPAGGCLLTETSFGNKIKDFIQYQSMDVEDIDFFKLGRHLRLSTGAKLIMGKNQIENERLMKMNYQNKYISLAPTEALPGPFCLLAQNASQEDIMLAGEILLSYTKAKIGETHPIHIDNTIELIELTNDKNAFRSMIIT